MVLLRSRQKEFFNSVIQDESPNSIRKRLAALASEAGADEQKVLKLISWTGESINSGTAVTDDIKYHMKLGRYVYITAVFATYFIGLAFADHNAVTFSQTKQHSCHAYSATRWTGRSRCIVLIWSRGVEGLSSEEGPRSVGW